MRQSVLIACVVALGLAAPASAAFPPNTLLAGTVVGGRGDASGAWCTMAEGPSSFLRSSSPAGEPAQISLPDTVFAATSSTSTVPYLMSGQATLTFGTASSGNLTFYFPATYPAGVRAPSFSDYSQSYNAAHVLIVNFTLHFPLGCDLPVRAYYRND